MAGSKLKVPASATLIISLALTLLQVLNGEQVFTIDAHWKAYIGVALLFAGVLGFNALANGAFAAALKLPQWANTLIAAVMAAALLAITTDTGISTDVHSIVAGVLQLLGTLGFGRAGVAFLAHRPAAHRAAAHRAAPTHRKAA